MRELSLIDGFHDGRRPTEDEAGRLTAHGGVAERRLTEAVLTLSRRPSRVPWIYEVYHAGADTLPEGPAAPEPP